jgi:hypothetical protein
MLITNIRNIDIERRTNMAELHKYLTGFAKYNKELPLYVENPFTESQIKLLRDTIEANRNRVADYQVVPGDQEMYHGGSRYDPKKIVHMSRQLVEFDCPKEIEEIMDSYAKEFYSEEIKLCHYNYIKYDLEYGDNNYAPALPPHIDADENLVTFNFQIGANIDDWQLVVSGKHFDLKTNDAIVFSAVNQVHWRPKRKWKPGEFLEIVSFDYCPPTNYRFTGEDNPIDQFLNTEKRKNYVDSLNNHPEFQSAWRQYHEEGLEIGIPENENGAIA